jgi:diguanylate cyclase (GGDEF)-like protein
MKNSTGLNCFTPILYQPTMKKSELTHLNKTLLLEDDSDIKANTRHPYLVIFIGKDSGRRHKIHQGIMTIGRSPQADIIIDDDRVSRIHCIIEWSGDTITLEDKGSTNGTYVDSRRVNRAPLHPGTPLQIGRSVMKIEYKDEVEIRSEDSLLRSASFDALTGIFNRQHFIKLASMELAYASRHKLPIGVIMMDIDDFKQVNDTYGHQRGDLVLAQFAKVVGGNMRSEDLFARYGGEEFIILSRGEINKEIMNVQCERIRKAIEHFEFRFEDACVRITVSLGFHLKKAANSDVETMLYDLIDKADEALYLAKERGRNRTETF